MERACGYDLGRDVFSGESNTAMVCGEVVVAGGGAGTGVEG